MENKELKLKDSLFLKKNNHFEKVTVEAIHMLKAEGDFTAIHTNSASFIYSMVLDKMEEILPPSVFIRVHKDYIVNSLAVSGFEGNLLHVDGNNVPVSKSYRDRVLELFKNNS